MNLVKNTLGVFMEGYETIQVGDWGKHIRVRIAEENGKWGYSLNVMDNMRLA